MVSGLLAGGLHTDPNAFSYPMGAGREAVSGADVLAWDKQQVADLLRRASEATGAATKEGGVEQGVERLVKAATATHALTRKLQFLTDETDAEKLGSSCEIFGKNTEAAARAFAFRTGKFRTSAVPPHDVVLIKPGVVDFL